MTSEAAEPLRDFIAKRIAEFDAIPVERRETLKKIAHYVLSQRDAGRPIRLTFICTHNSRRSQMSQVLASIAAAHFRVEGVHVFSGGTEATAFNPRAVAALQRAGVKVEKQPAVLDGENYQYAVSIPGNNNPLDCFSKVYNQPPNPETDFAAIMTCSEADKNCPAVAGAAARIALPYDDPKAADGTKKETATYDERCAQIAREMLYVFSLVKDRRAR
jgi:protein-tyrosine-phosphatase